MTTYELYEEGCHYDTIEAESISEALEEAISNVDRNNYPDCDNTLYINVCVYDRSLDEQLTETVVLQPDEPYCYDDNSHEWESPFHIVGGIESNPGVWGNGGGVIINECCMICGCKRTTNTWAQNPETGEQGYTSIAYETDYYSEYL